MAHTKLFALLALPSAAAHMDVLIKALPKSY